MISLIPFHRDRHRDALYCWALQDARSKYCNCSIAAIAAAVAIDATVAIGAIAAASAIPAIVQIVATAAIAAINAIPNAIKMLESEIIFYCL